LGFCQVYAVSLHVAMLVWRGHAPQLELVPVASLEADIGRIPLLYKCQIETNRWNVNADIRLKWEEIVSHKP